MRTLLGHPLTRILLVVLAGVGVVAMLWWRGPNTHTIRHAFDKVRVEVGAGRDRLQPAVGDRPRVRVEDRDRRRDATAAPALPARLLRVLGGAVRERRAAGSRGRAGAGGRAHAADAGAKGALGDARRHGVRAPRLRPRAGGDPRRVRRLLREDPGLGGHVPDCRGRRRRGALHLRVRERAAASRLAARGARLRPSRGHDGPPRARRDARRLAGRAGDLVPVPRLDLPAPRGLHGDARLRHPRADARRRARARADERGDDLPALARERRPDAGGGCAAARGVRRALFAGLRVRDRAAGDRGVGRDRDRSDLPRARGDLARDAARDAGRRAAPTRRSTRPRGWSRTMPGARAIACPAS